MKQIIVTIDAEGHTQVETHGITGTGCQQETAALEKALGSVTEDAKKLEYFQAPKQGIGAKQHG